MSKSVYWVLGCLLFCNTALCADAQADQRCWVQVDSYRGETLDARAPLSAQELKAFATFRHATPDQYSQQELPYTELHQRVLAEAHLSASTPVVLISSIGIPQKNDFVVLLAYKNGDVLALKHCAIKLTQKPELKSKPVQEKDLSAAQILAILLNALGTSRGVSAVELMTELIRLQQQVPLKTGQSRIVFQLNDEVITEQFIGGLKKLMTPQEQQVFDKNLEERKSKAVLDALFLPASQNVLLGLFKQGIAEARSVGKFNVQTSQQMEPEEMRQLLIKMQNSLIQSQAQAALQQRADETIRFQAQRDSSGWEHLQRWILLRNFWMGVAVFFGFLSLWLIVRIIVIVCTTQDS